MIEAATTPARCGDGEEPTNCSVVHGGTVTSFDPDVELDEGWE
ncbi:hypothetical protein [uncultured Aeromicrobium sp.]|nr:hypothetical protein [uncultured Aeromicrobium sp.]